MIGHIGGLKEKIDAAAKAGLKKVLIPQGDRFLKSGNRTLDMAKYGEAYGIQVTEVADLVDAMRHFTGKNYSSRKESPVVSTEYSKTMKSLADKLCNKTMEIASTAMSRKEHNISAEVIESEKNAINLSERANDALGNGAYYAAASYCFGANVRYEYVGMLLSNYTDEEIRSTVERYRHEIRQFELPKYVTLTDIQTYSLVKERLEEAEDSLNLTLETLGTRKEEALFNLAYAIHRIESARSWAQFFGKGIEKLKLGESELQDICLTKLAEAEERYEYVQIYLPTALTRTRAELNRAHTDRESGSYEMC